jgi:glycosyltransferase involved in cell wall biosynthesis
MMDNILINGLNSNSAGGASVFRNFVRCLIKNNKKDCNYYILSTVQDLESNFNTKPLNIKYIYLPKLLINPALILCTYYFLFRYYEWRLGVKKILNFGDLIPYCSSAVTYYFDWSYAVYPNHTIWKDMDKKSYLIRKLKLLQIRSRIKKVSCIIAQTDVIKKKLFDEYKVNNVLVVNNAVDVDAEGVYKNFNLPDGEKFLYLTRYYPHKNLESLIPLAMEIKHNGTDYKFIITIDSEQHSGSRKLLNEISLKNLDDIIINIGSVNMNYVASLYAQCDHLFMPSLLESFSGTYVEAMFYKRTILTSNLDFAETVCKKSAFYFDPCSTASMYSTMVEAVENKVLSKLKITEGTRLVTEMSNWDDCSSKIINILNKVNLSHG